jgi:ABC-type branched-subunit amino acid transport system substrate-binding protein
MGRRPTTSSLRAKGAILLLGMLVVAAACGQKPLVVDQPVPAQPVVFALPPGATVDPETGQVLDAEGNVIGDVTSLGDTTAGAGGGAEGSGGASVETTRAAGAAQKFTTDEEPVGGDSAGVTDSTIKIGAHAPLTGAAPVPSDSAQKGVALYWKWLTENDQTINGRDVEVILRNDNYNPSTAVAVCKEMVERDHVFILFGFAGTDQIQACARYAASAGVPYVSVGVTEIGVDRLPNYFSITLSWPEQTPLLADLLTSQLGARGEKNGMLRFDTPNFQDAHDSFVAAMDKMDAPVSYDAAVSKGAGTGEARSVVQQMKNEGIENVFVLTSPVWFLQVLSEAKSQQYEPQWVGVGITKGLDTVASIGCRSGTLNRAKFFSPFPAWADIDRFDPDFKKAMHAVYPDKGDGDDIILIGWGMSKVMAPLLTAPGRDLSRERFVYFSERQRGIKTGVYPSVSFSPGDHFGGSAVHLNEAQCSGYKAGDNRWHTITSNATDF